MLEQATVDKLQQMKLSAMAEAFRKQIQDQSLAGLSFEDRFGLIVDSEWAKRKNNHLIRLIRNAAFSDPGACIENIEYSTDRKLDKTQIATLATCNYIQERHNIIILGAAGAGKSYLGCAFGIAACRSFYAAKYIRLPELFNDLAVARGEGTFKKLLKEYKRISLLILDEWLLVPLSSQEARDLLEIVEARHKRASTIFISQFAPQGWHQRIGEATLADAILDRIVHDSYTICIEGKDSMRKKKGIKA
ncbi:MAG TPA: IS21-like element helper ATPase IstB [Dehalococcoidia bacterium]|nr:IS21-like element helper ATPase IstB [Dehalococcoidia bacterium]